MKRTACLAIALAITVAFSANVLADDDGKWLHVRVDELSANGEKVSVNVPLSLVEALVPLIDHDEIYGGKLRLSGHDLTAAELRAVHKALSTAPDGEFVTIAGSDENVRVAKEGGYLLVNVDSNDRHSSEDDESGESAGADRKKHAEHVEARIPMDVVEALLSSGTDELDLMAAIRALAEHGETELVAVSEGDGTVRVWVDSSPAGRERGQQQ
ncbi:MAG: hypothetical protein ACKVU1_04665 [bacterium]